MSRAGEAATSPNHLYHNEGNGKSQDTERSWRHGYKALARRAGLGGERGARRGCVAAVPSEEMKRICRRENHGGGNTHRKAKEDGR